MNENIGTTSTNGSDQRLSASNKGGCSDRRRIMLGAIAGTAAALVVPIAAKAQGSGDAKLLALCARFEVNERRYLGLFPGAGPSAIIDDDERDPIVNQIQDQQAELVDQMTALKVTSLAGFAAVARCLGLWDNTIGDPDDGGSVNEQLVALLVRGARQVA